MLLDDRTPTSTDSRMFTRFVYSRSTHVPAHSDVIMCSQIYWHKANTSNLCALARTIYVTLLLWQRTNRQVKLRHLLCHCCWTTEPQRRFVGTDSEWIRIWAIQPALFYQRHYCRLWRPGHGWLTLILAAAGEQRLLVGRARLTIKSNQLLHSKSIQASKYYAFNISSLAKCILS